MGKDIENKIGRIVSLDYILKNGERILFAYLGGIAPVKIVTNNLTITQEKFDQMLEENVKNGIVPGMIV